jgi:hypothetical protein
MSNQKSNSARVIDFVKNNEGVPFDVGGHTVFYAETIGMPKNSIFAVEYKAESGGNVKLKLELEQGNSLPVDEGLQDDNYCVPDDNSEINDELSDELLHIKSFSPATTAYGRIKISGLEDPSGNDASTKITALKISYILAI